MGTQGFMDSSHCFIALLGYFFICELGLGGLFPSSTVILVNFNFHCQNLLMGNVWGLCPFSFFIRVLGVYRGLWWIGGPIRPLGRKRVQLLLFLFTSSFFFFPATIHMFFLKQRVVMFPFWTWRSCWVSFWMSGIMMTSGWILETQRRNFSSLLCVCLFWNMSTLLSSYYGDCWCCFDFSGNGWMPVADHRSPENTIGYDILKKFIVRNSVWV